MHADPTYRDLGDHTESIQIDYDPAEISYEELLKLFWSSHNPCARASLQYRSIIFYGSEEQRKAAIESRDREQAKRGKIRTEILPAPRFYLAEDYHQKYYLRNDVELMKEFRDLNPSEFVHSTAAARVNGYLGGHGPADRVRAEVDRLGLSPEGRKNLLRRMGIKASEPCDPSGTGCRRSE